MTPLYDVLSIFPYVPADYPPRTWQAIAQGMRGQAARFQAGLAGLPVHHA